MDTRLFFVVSTTRNEELFETLEDARGYALDNRGVVRIALVRNAYREQTISGHDSFWNYEDRSDTFTYFNWNDTLSNN